MRNLLRADIRRMFRGRAFRRCLITMLLVSIGLVWMQATAMDYTVPYSRVVFLSQLVFGLAVAALTGVYVSEDFASGVVRNKLIAGHGRAKVYLSNLLVSCAANAAIFALTSAFTAVIALPFFEVDTSLIEILAHFALGLPMCLSYASIYCLLAMLLCDKARSVIACMGFAFGMLALCMQLNSILVHADAAAMAAPRLRLCALVYDLVPMGQAAQLSMMKYLNPLRCALLNLIWLVVAPVLGCFAFRAKDIQ